MHKLLYLITTLTLLAFIACSKDKSACDAAEKYYGYLIKGDVERYVRSLHNYDELDEAYRSQLCDMFAQYLERERQLRKGIVAAKAVRDSLIDSLQSLVFVEIEFGDSTREQVILPLLRTEKGWKLK